MPLSVDCSIIVPVYDERESLGPLVEQIRAAFSPLDRTFEIIVVDDGSRDGTWAVLRELSHRTPELRCLRLRRNFGKSIALSAGVAKARGRTVITIDGDLQDDPAEIPRFLEALGESPRLVSGWKVDRRDPLSKRVPSKVFNYVTSLACGVKMHDHNCGFKAGPLELYQSIPLYGELHRYIPALAHDLGYEIVEIRVNHRTRQFGTSKFGVERYVRGLLDLVTVLMLTRYRRRPGHLLGGLGLAMGLTGFLVLAYLSGVWLFTDEPIGARPLLALGILLMVLAVQFVSFGIIAELIVNRSELRDHPNLIAEDLDGRR